MAEHEVPAYYTGPVPEEFIEDVIQRYHIPRMSRFSNFLQRIIFPRSIPQQIWVDMFSRSLISQQRAQDGEEKARRQAELGMYDDITGLLNGAAFRRESNHRLHELNPHETRRRLMPNAALGVHLDLKGQKKVNDTRGHEAGNENLRNAGVTLLKVARPGDLVARIGGDEFAALYFYRTDLVLPEEMKSDIDANLFKFFKVEIDMGNISGAKWASVNWEPGKDIVWLLNVADPIESNQLRIEYPSKDVMPDRR